MLIPDIFDRYPEYQPRKGVLHVGAHTLEEEPLYYRLGLTDAQILWIEANEDLIPKAKAKTNILCAVIGNTDDAEVTLKITNNLQSSSILSLKTHLQEHPWVQETTRRVVKTITLDTLFERHQIAFDQFDCMNLDIQGAEKMALEGATRILPHIRSIYTEVNVKELYEQCAQMDELDGFLEPLGFRRVETVMTPHGWGDAFYINIKLKNSDEETP